MKKVLALCVLFCLGISLAFSQTNKKISGKITDETGAGLQAASVLLTGSAKGVQTDASGNFTI